MRITKSLTLSVALLAAVPSFADDTRREVVHFSAASSRSTIKSSVKGYQTVQYSLSVTGGQKMSVQLDAKNSSLYFNITAPGADAAMYNSSIDGNGTTITIPSSGSILSTSISCAMRRGEARPQPTTSHSTSNSQSRHRESCIGGNTA